MADIRDERLKKLEKKKLNTPGESQAALSTAQAEFNGITSDRQNLVQQQFSQLSYRNSQLDQISSSAMSQIQSTPVQSRTVQPKIRTTNGLNSQTQQILKKYGVDPKKPNDTKTNTIRTKPQIQKSTTSSPSVIKTENKTINNTRTTSNIKIVQPQIATQAPQITTRYPQIKLADPNQKVRNWVSDQLQKQNQSIEAQRKDFQKRDWGLSRGADRMMRKIEEAGKRFASSFNPKKLASATSSQFKVLLLLAGAYLIKNALGPIRDGIEDIVKFFKKDPSTGESKFENLFSKSTKIISNIGEFIKGGWEELTAFLQFTIDDRKKALSQVGDMPEYGGFWSLDTLPEWGSRFFSWLGRIMTAGFGGTKALAGMQYLKDKSDFNSKVSDDLKANTGGTGIDKDDINIFGKLKSDSVNKYTSHRLGAEVDQNGQYNISMTGKKLQMIRDVAKSQGSVTVSSSFADSLGLTSEKGKELVDGVSIKKQRYRVVSVETGNFKKSENGRKSDGTIPSNDDIKERAKELYDYYIDHGQREGWILKEEKTSSTPSNDGATFKNRIFLVPEEQVVGPNGSVLNGSKFNEKDDRDHYKFKVQGDDESKERYIITNEGFNDIAKTFDFSEDFDILDDNYRKYLRENAYKNTPENTISKQDERSLDELKQSKDNYEKVVNEYETNKEQFMEERRQMSPSMQTFEKGLEWSKDKYEDAKDYLNKNINLRDGDLLKSLLGEKKFRISGKWGEDRKSNRTSAQIRKSEGKPEGSDDWWITHHKGVDVATPVGTPLFAPIDGKVIGVHDGMDGAGGRYLKIKDQNSDSVYFFCHLDSINNKLKDIGATFEKGTEIAKTGDNWRGKHQAAHLHFQTGFLNRQNHPEFNKENFNTSVDGDTIWINPEVYPFNTEILSKTEENQADSENSSNSESELPNPIPENKNPNTSTSSITESEFEEKNLKTKESKVDIIKTNNPEENLFREIFYGNKSEPWDISTKEGYDQKSKYNTWVNNELKLKDQEIQSSLPDNISELSSLYDIGKNLQHGFLSPYEEEQIFLDKYYNQLIQYSPERLNQLFEDLKIPTRLRKTIMNLLEKQENPLEYVKNDVDYQPIIEQSSLNNFSTIDDTETNEPIETIGEDNSQTQKFGQTTFLKGGDYVNNSSTQTIYNQFRKNDYNILVSSVKF